MLENYADPIDRASVEQERTLQENLRAALLKPPAPMPLIGQCYNCDEPLEGMRFCDADCRDDYVKRTKSRK